MFIYFWLGVALLLVPGFVLDYYDYEKKKMSKLGKVISFITLILGMDFLLAWLFLL